MMISVMYIILESIPKEPAVEFKIDLFKPKIEVNIIHAGEILSFPANAFTKKPFEKGYDPFYEINEFWAKKPRQFQDDVFSVYKSVYNAFDYIMNADELYTELNILIGQLFQLHPIEELELWLRLNPGITVPDSVKDSLPDPTDNTKTLGKTYTVSDYYPLIALSMFLRTLIPIWGEYIAAIRQNTKVDRKEYNAMKLLTDTGIMECPAMVRLRVFIDETTASSEGIDWERVLDGFSSEDLGFLMVSLVCVRQLCLADLRGVDPHTQAIAMVWKFLMHRAFSVNDSSIEIKRSRDGESSGNEQHSILESYRRRTEISIGDIAEFDQYLSLTYDIARRLEPDITREEVASCLETAKEIEVENIGDAQLIIAGWLLKDQITPHAPYYITNSHISMIAALEAVLWKRDFKHLAAIISSYAIMNTEELAVGYINTREQLSPSLITEIKKYYPYEWGTSKKKMTAPQHGVIESIDHVADQLLFNSWRMTLAEPKTLALFGERRRKLIIPSDIKDTLGRLIIDIESRR